MAGNRNSGRHRKPLALVSGGRSHISTEERERRMAAEGNVGDDSIACPPYVQDEQSRAAFGRLARQLRDMGIWSALDADELARYVTAEAQYEAWAVEHNRCIAAGDTDGAVTAQRRQHIAYSEAHASASTLGLNVTGRLKLAGPLGGEQPRVLEL